MGGGWRRFSQKVKEATHTSSIPPTSTARCTTMLSEAKEFAAQLRKCEAGIRQMKNANEEMLKTVKSAMLVPLPHVYEETAAAAGGAIKPLETTGGPTFSAESVSGAWLDASQQLESEVLAPMARWMDVFHSLERRNKDVEGARLELDSRRREVAALKRRIDATRAKVAGGSGGAKADARLTETIQLLQHKEGKLQVAHQSFEDQESLLFDDLTALIRDAAWLRNYVQAALRVEGRALLAAADAFGDLAAVHLAAATASAQPPAQLGAPAPAAAAGSLSGLHGGGGEPHAKPAPYAKAEPVAQPAASAGAATNPFEV